MGKQKFNFNSLVELKTIYELMDSDIHEARILKAEIDELESGLSREKSNNSSLKKSNNSSLKNSNKLSLKKSKNSSRKNSNKLSMTRLN